MRVLTINTSPAFYDGITNVIVNINHALDKERVKMDLVVVAEPSKDFIEKMKLEQSNVIYLSRSMHNILFYMYSLMKIIKANKYDIVHIHGNSHTTIIELISAWLAGCQVRIVHSHNTFCVEKVIHLLATPIFNRLCTHRMACGYEAGKFMYGSHSFNIVNNGINTERFMFDEKIRNDLRSKYKLSGKMVIGHVGTLYNDHKNQSFLLDVLNELKNKHIEYHLCLIGDGVDKKKLIDKAKQLNLQSCVTFVGAVEDAAPFLSAFDIVAMPSKYEGLPLSLIEEQANGLKCIVSDRITKEVDKTGNVYFLSLEKGAGYWAKVIDSINIDINRREKTSKMAIQTIKKEGYDIETETSKLMDFYYSIFDLSH